MKLQERWAIMIGIMIFSIWPVIYGQYGPFELGNDQTIINQDLEQAINAEGSNGQAIDDPLREGAYFAIDAQDTDTPEAVIENIVGVGEQIDEHRTALENTLTIVKKSINYALWLLALVALIYLIYNGFMMVTAAGNETQFKKWVKGLKTAIIAIVWVGISRFIVSIIFWIIEKITTTGL